MKTQSNPIDQRSNGDTEVLVLSVREAARLLGISRDLAYGLVRTGHIPSLKFGRRVVGPKQRLLGMIDGGAEQRERVGTPVDGASEVRRQDRTPEGCPEDGSDPRADPDRDGDPAVLRRQVPWPKATRSRR
jgi:excisionase family DNA binding protein